MDINAILNAYQKQQLQDIWDRMLMPVLDVAIATLCPPEYATSNITSIRSIFFQRIYGVFFSAFKIVKHEKSISWTSLGQSIMMKIELLGTGVPELVLTKFRIDFKLTAKSDECQALYKLIADVSRESVTPTSQHIYLAIVRYAGKLQGDSPTLSLFKTMLTNDSQKGLNQVGDKQELQFKFQESEVEVDGVKNSKNNETQGGDPE